ncbi:MAG: hypothetical protein WA136_11350 [Rhodoferax sp.]
MNTQTHRLIFNSSWGFLMAVAETIGASQEKVDSATLDGNYGSK